jgi:hypothetical protein
MDNAIKALEATRKLKKFSNQRMLRETELIERFKLSKKRLSKRAIRRARGRLRQAIYKNWLLFFNNVRL